MSHGLQPFKPAWGSHTLTMLTAQTVLDAHALTIAQNSSSSIRDNPLFVEEEKLIPGLLYDPE